VASPTPLRRSRVPSPTPSRRSRGLDEGDQAEGANTLKKRKPANGKR